MEQKQKTKEQKRSKKKGGNGDQLLGKLKTPEIEEIDQKAKQVVREVEPIVQRGCGCGW